MTKSIITFAVAVLLCFSVAAQDFISPVKQWNVRLAALGYSTEVFKIAGDSLVEGTSYNKIWVSYDSLTTWVFQGLLREASDVVYYMPPGHSEGVLYDFNLGVGATAMVRNIFCGDEDIPITVIHMDTVAYFPLIRGVHSKFAMEPITSTTQILIEVYKYSDNLYIHPVKVENRDAPDMYRLHVLDGDEASPYCHIPQPRKKGQPT